MCCFVQSGQQAVVAWSIIVGLGSVIGIFDWQFEVRWLVKQISETSECNAIITIQYNIKKQTPVFQASIRR